MSQRSEELNGRHSIEAKGTMDEAFKASQFVEEGKSRTSNVRRQADNYVEVSVKYAMRHPWRIAIAAASIGVIAGAFFSRRTNVDKNN